MDIRDEVKTTPHDYFRGKLPHRTYVSHRIKRTNPEDNTEVNIRIVSKVIDAKDFYELYKDKNHIVLRTTPKERQEVIARVNEDTRGFGITIQRFDKRKGYPLSMAYCFRGDELSKLIDFLRSLKVINFDNPAKFKVEDEEINQMVKFMNENPDLLMEVIEKSITTKDVVALGYRKEQLGVFKKLLDNTEYFSSKKNEWGKKRDEDVWQHFFEINPWIFGYGLNYIFNSPLEGKKLQQVVEGNDVVTGGKRVDAILKTRGKLSSLCLVEIKNHTTPLLKEIKNSYRPDVWPVSDELNGGIIQSQKSVQKTLENVRMSPKFCPTNRDGAPTGEVIYSYKPKAYLVIGNLSKFSTENGDNTEKFSSFELFRKNLDSPEIITYDELYERAKYIVDSSDETSVDDNPLDDGVVIDDQSSFADFDGSSVQIEDIPF